MSAPFKSAAAFVAEYEPLAYVVEPIIRTSSVYTLTASTGSGKTALSVVMALAVATGRQDILGLDVEQGRVAYLAFENPDDVRMRLKVAAHALQVDLAALGDDLIVADARQAPEQLTAGLRKASQDGDFALVILDTLAAGFDGENVNDNVEAGAFVRRMRPIVNQVAGKPALVMMAHPVKGAGDDRLVPYGAGAILNEVDGNLTLAMRGGPNTTVLHWQGKFRGLEFAPVPFAFARKATAPGLVDKKGRLVPLPVLRPATGSIAEAASETKTNDVALLAVIRDRPNATQKEMALSIGTSPATINRLLKGLTDTKLAAPNGAGKYRLTAKGSERLDGLSTFQAVKRDDVPETAFH